MSKKNLIIAFILVLLSLLWLFVPHTSCEAAEMMSEQQKCISVQMQQWNTLKKNTQLLDANLKLLQDNLTAQEQRQSELMNLLQQARNELTKTQQALMNANASLANAEKSLQIANEYTVKLRKQIEAERKAAAEAKERAYWKGWLNGFCVGLVTTGIAVITK